MFIVVIVIFLLFVCLWFQCLCVVGCCCCCCCCCYCCFLLCCHELSVIVLLIVVYCCFSFVVKSVYRCLWLLIAVYWCLLLLYCCLLSFQFFFTYCILLVLRCGVRLLRFPPHIKGKARWSTINGHIVLMCQNVAVRIWPFRRQQ